MCNVLHFVSFNNLGYSQDLSQRLHNNAHYLLSKNDEQLLVQELFYRIRPRIMRHDDLDEKSYESQKNNLDFNVKLNRMGCDIDYIEDMILDEYNQETLDEIFRDPYSISTPEAQDTVLQIVQKMTLKNLKLYERYKQNK